MRRWVSLVSNFHNNHQNVIPNILAFGWILIVLAGLILTQSIE